MLHELSEFAGDIEVTRDGEDRAQGYQLSFARARPYFSCKVQDGDRVITLLSVEGGGLEVYERTRPRAASAEEEAHFRLASDLLDPRAIEVVEPGPDQYRLRLRGTWYTIRITPRGGGVHGHSPARRK